MDSRSVYRPLASALLVVSGAGHGIAICLAYMVPRGAGAPATTAYYVPLLLLSLALLVPVAAMAHDPGGLWLYLVAKVGIVLLIVIPLPEAAPLKVTALCVLAAEICLALPRPWAAAATLVALAAALASQSSRKAWEEAIAPASLRELAYLALLPALAAVTAGGYRAALLGYRRSALEARRLREGSLAIIAANVRFQEQAQRLEDESSARERERIVREIHDIVGYTIANQTMAMEAALVLLGDEGNRERLRSLLTEARDQSRDCHAEIRSALYDLRRREAPYETFQGRLVSICRTFERSTGVEVSCVFVGDQPALPAGLDSALYRIVQAALTNSFMHGKARSVRVLAQGLEGVLHLSIDDDGEGAAPGETAEGIGLSGMRQRLEPFGGELSYGDSGHGFAVKAVVPLEDRNRRAEAYA